MGTPSARSAKVHAEHQPAIRSVLERAVAVAEPARCRGELDDVQRLAIHGAHRNDRLGHVLSIGADVLDRCRARKAGNSRKALEAGQSAPHGLGDHAIPGLARGHARVHAIAGSVERDSAQGNADHQAGKSGVGDDHIGAAAEHEHRQVARGRPAQGFERARLVSDGREVTCGAAQLQGRERRERRLVGNLERQN